MLASSRLFQVRWKWLSTSVSGVLLKGRSTSHWSITRSLGAAMENTSPSVSENPVKLAIKEEQLSGDERCQHEAGVFEAAPASSTTPPSGATPTFVFGSHASSSGEFSYINKGFTSEVFKIELANLPNNIGYKVRSLPSGKKRAWLICTPLEEMIITFISMIMPD